MGPASRVDMGLQPRIPCGVQASRHRDAGSNTTALRCRLQWWWWLGGDGQFISRLGLACRAYLVLCTTGNKADALEIMQQNPAGALPNALYRTMHLHRAMYAA